MTEYDSDLLRQGILHWKSKELPLARRYFERALDTADDLQTKAEASYYLSLVTDDPRQKRRLLEDTLAIDMGHPAARRELAILDGRLKTADIVDPDSLPTSRPGEQPAASERFTCPQCGGRLVYAPQGDGLVCENCAHRQALQSEPLNAGQDFFVGMADGTGFHKTLAAMVFQCRGCGARYMLPPSALSATCAYCGSPHVIATDREQDLLEPDAILPMAFDQQAASRQLADWLRRHARPLPTIRALRGLYLPVWTFDLIGSVPWSGQVMRDRRPLHVSGESPAVLHDLCIPASRVLAGMERPFFSGFQFASARSYDAHILAGWPAELPAISMSEAALEARALCGEKVRADIRSTQGLVDDLRFSPAAISISSYKLVLIPVWVVELEKDSTHRRLCLNGQTGAVQEAASRVIPTGTA